MARLIFVISLLVLPPMLAAGCSCPGEAPARGRRGPYDSISFLTYNVLADPVELPERLPALMQLIDASDADVIALQEVAPWLIKRLGQESWVRQYHVTERKGAVFAPGGQLIFSKIPIIRTSHAVLPGSQKRTVLIAHLDLEGRTMAVATTHMESPLEDGPTRAKQLDVIFSMLSKEPHAVLLGDLNFGDREEPETSRLDKGYTDLWQKLHPNDRGLTWNMETSPMAKAGSFPGEQSRRIDRMLIRSEHWHPDEIRIIGDQPLSQSGALFPSDHFGLFARIRLQGSSHQAGKAHPAP